MRSRHKTHRHSIAGERHFEDFTGQPLGLTVEQSFGRDGSFVTPAPADLRNCRIRLSERVALAVFPLLFQPSWVKLYSKKWRGYGRFGCLYRWRSNSVCCIAA